MRDVLQGSRHRQSRKADRQVVSTLRYRQELHDLRHAATGVPDLPVPLVDDRMADHWKPDRSKIVITPGLEWQ
jgi:hypothetical protein